MKSYPSIDTKINKHQHVIVFDKLDGSNIRAEWSAKRGFYKFGTRTKLLDVNDPILGKSQQMFLDKYSQDLQEIFVRNKWQSVVVFFEFGGPNSFAGSHEKKDNHDVVLFDVDVYKKGLLEPKVFLELFGHLHIPAVLFEGFITPELIDSVKQSTLQGMTLEGVVCKYKHSKLNTSSMFKIKSSAWLEKLNEKCNGNEELFRRLR